MSKNTYEKRRTNQKTIENYYLFITPRIGFETPENENRFMKRNRNKK